MFTNHRLSTFGTARGMSKPAFFTHLPSGETARSGETTRSGETARSGETVRSGEITRSGETARSGVLVTLEEGSRGRAGGREQGGRTCSEGQKGCWVSIPGRVLIRLNSGVHSVILGTGNRHACVVRIGCI